MRWGCVLHSWPQPGGPQHGWVGLLIPLLALWAREPQVDPPTDFPEFPAAAAPRAWLSQGTEGEQHEESPLLGSWGRWRGSESWTASAFEALRTQETIGLVYMFIFGHTVTH